MEFTLTVRFGNDAMQTGDDLAAALRRIAEQVEVLGEPAREFGRPVFDTNGARVGAWNVGESVDPDAMTRRSFL